MAHTDARGRKFRTSLNLRNEPSQTGGGQRYRRQGQRNSGDRTKPEQKRNTNALFVGISLALPLLCSVSVGRCCCCCCCCCVPESSLSNKLPAAADENERRRRPTFHFRDALRALSFSGRTVWVLFLFVGFSFLFISRRALRAVFFAVGSSSKPICIRSFGGIAHFVATPLVIFIFYASQVSADFL